MNGRVVRNLLKCVTFSNTHKSIVRSSQISWIPQTNRALYSIWSVHNDHRYRCNNFLPAHRKYFANGLVGSQYRTISTTIAQYGQSKPQLRPNAPDNRKHIATQRKGSVDKTEETSPEEQTSKIEEKPIQSTAADNEPTTLTQRFKQMYKDYWYILLPVHMSLSCLWMGSLYYLSSSGVDIPAILESLHFSVETITKLKDSSLGHLALAFMCYKIITPVRYITTLGGTTVAIKYLSQWGYIKPVSSKAQLQKIYYESKAKLQKKL